MFPTAGAQVYYNDAGEPLGWDYPGYDDGPDPGDFDTYDYDDDGDEEDDEGEEELPSITVSSSGYLARMPGGWSATFDDLDEARDAIARREQEESQS